jgi:predicted nicotinamide N-methyase
MKYTTYEFDQLDIHLTTLRDSQEYEDINDEALKLGIESSVWSLFGVLWPAGQVLAHLVSKKETKNLRILEVGCGVALPSHVLNSRGDNIVATDYHPMTSIFLDKNSKLNERPDIPYFLCDWEGENPELGTFDLIIGSDILYQQDHCNLLAKFIDSHANPLCEVIIVDPGRGRKNKLTNQMLTNGFSSEHIKPVLAHPLKEVFKGYILKFNR